jgi:23S rRNA (guanosine2251-2'-O)-methyltransferase
VIEGVRPVIESIRAGRRRIFEIGLPATGAGSPGLSELSALMRERGIPARAATPGEGVVASADPFPEEPFEDLLLDERPRFLVALDRVTDVGNLGAIARSAEAAGATGLVLEERRTAPIGPGALRASAGALEHLRVGRTPSLGRALELSAAEGLAVLVAEREGAPLDRVDPALLRGDLVWVFGSEDRGTRAAIRRRAAVLVGIPLAGAIASLGVAAAAAHLLLRTAEIRVSKQNSP